MTKKKMSSGVAKLVPDVAASLSKYAGKVKPGTSMDKMKEKAWEYSVIEKTGKRASQKRDAMRHKFYQAVTDVLQNARRKAYH
ncbi:MAG: hypothetical protein Q8K68_12690, partial [Nitrospirota bacterium]|nr:hypothetical protein [Nitrospirota bacterium]